MTRFFAQRLRRTAISLSIMVALLPTAAILFTVIDMFVSVATAISANFGKLVGDALLDRRDQIDDIIGDD